MATQEKTLMVVGFMFNKNKTDVLLIQKNRPAWQFGKLNGIGGKVEKNEGLIDAMIREFQEETSIDCEGWISVITMHGVDWEAQVYACSTDDVFHYSQLEDEKLCLIPITDLDKYEHINNLRWLIPMSLNVLDHVVINYALTKPLTP